jgi:NitT/TauT family transport system permease protein
VFAVGLSAALVLGIVLGLLMGRYRLAEYILDPFVYAFDATPRVALIPLLLLWFGLGTSSKIAIVFLSGLFPVLMNTFSGVRTVSGHLVDIGRAYGAREGKIFTKIILPAALPFIMAGIRLAVGRALIGIITAEMFTAVSGIGALLIRYSSALATDKFFVPVILLALLGVILSSAVERLQKRLAPWKETERAL